MSDIPKKDDAGKPLASLMLCPGGMGIAQALTVGASDYGRYDYLVGEGISVSRLADAACRHLADYLARVDFDKKSGLHHLYHFGANGVMLANLVALGLGIDDRWSSTKVTRGRPNHYDLSDLCLARAP